MILLSFDIEEFDVPLEYGQNIIFEEQIEVSKRGTIIILDILKEFNIQATFFCTVVFAQNASEVIHRIIDEGHELASHGWRHSKFDIQDLSKTKEYFETKFKIEIFGFRMAKMMSIAPSEVRESGYSYNSSINPTYIPGRYNYFRMKRVVNREAEMWQVPTSVSPLVRFPLFWLSFHNLPFFLYQKLSLYTLSKDKYLHLYFHPWEFMDLTKPEYGLPKYISRNSGTKMSKRFETLIKYLKQQNLEFYTIKEFLKIRN